MTLILITHLSYGKCSGDDLKTSDIQRFFAPGEMTSKKFATLELDKRVRRCNTFSGCEKWSSPKASLHLGEMINSSETELTYRHYPTRGEAYFKLTNQGELRLIVEFYSLDISARVKFIPGKKTITLAANSYYRPSGAFSQPMSYASYFDEQEKTPFTLKGVITNKCIELSTKFTQKREGIIYDEFEISLSGSIE